MEDMKELTLADLDSISSHLRMRSRITSLAIVLGVEGKVDEALANNKDDIQAAVYEVLKGWFNSQSSPRTARSKITEALTHTNVGLNMVASKVFGKDGAQGTVQEINRHGSSKEQTPKLVALQIQPKYVSASAQQQRKQMKPVQNKVTSRAAVSTARTKTPVQRQVSVPQPTKAQPQLKRQVSVPQTSGGRQQLQSQVSLSELQKASELGAAEEPLLLNTETVNEQVLVIKEASESISEDAQEVAPEDAPELAQADEAELASDDERELAPESSPDDEAELVPPEMVPDRPPQEGAQAAPGLVPDDAPELVPDRPAQEVAPPNAQINRSTPGVRLVPAQQPTQRKKSKRRGPFGIFRK